MISIIIIVKNDPGIENTLAKLVTIPKPGQTEIIVVDASEGKLDTIKNNYPEVRWIPFISNKKKRISIPEQRNLGVKEAKGEIIVFIDANCIPSNNWLIAITKPILTEHENIVCGKTISAERTTIHDQFYNQVHAKQYIEECATINLAIKHTIFKHVGYFDESFEYGSDVDFIWRTTDIGKKIRYISGAVITHDWGDIKQEIKRSFRYGAARARLYKKHYKKIDRLIKKDYPVLIYAIYILFSPISIVFPWYVVLLSIPFIKNINKQPLQVMRDHFIYAGGFLYQCIRQK